MRPALCPLGLLLCAALAAPARAQEGAGPAASAPPAPAGAAAPAAPAAPAGAEGFGHEAVLRLAASRNLAILARGLDRKRAAHVADAARRPYLPEVGLEAAVRETVGQPYRAIEWLPSVTYRSAAGTGVSGSARFVDGVAGNLESERSFTIELSQALLGRGFYGAGAGLHQLDLDVEIAREAFREELNRLLVRADRAYWELAYAREDVEIKRRSRDRARDQFEETKENIRRGLLAPGEIFVVEENVVDFEERLNRAEEGLALAENALRRVLYLPAAYPVRASFTGDPKAAADLPEADSVGVATTRNPGVVAARLAAERARTGIDGEAGQALPQLDVFGQLGVASGTDRLGVALPSDPEVRAGVRLSVPIYWGADAARVDRARTEHLQRRLDLRDAEADAGAAVRDASIRLRARRSRLDLAGRIVELARSKLEVEREKYKSGLSTLADVVRFQRELDAAHSGALRARLDLLTARAELLAARGDLHEAVGVKVQ